jgi:hypothetical protein
MSANSRNPGVSRPARTILSVALLALAAASCVSGPKLSPVTGKVFAGGRPDRTRTDQSSGLEEVNAFIS